MKTKQTIIALSGNKPGKRAYQSPKLQTLGSVKKLTLKLGSATDGMGGFM